MLKVLTIPLISRNLSSNNSLSLPLKQGRIHGGRIWEISTPNVKIGFLLTVKNNFIYYVKFWKLKWIKMSKDAVSE